jgi:1-pyrroline-5-carboxylate dehydrogenase
MAKGAAELGKPEVQEFFAKLIQRLVPKSWAQSSGEPNVTRKWMENYSCDNVRYLARSFGVPGDHAGQQSTGIRMPFGGVSVITPFNFPLEIPALQTCSALFMGNQPTVKVDAKVAICMEQFLRMLHSVGLPMTDVDFVYSDGPVFNELAVAGNCRMTLFTGSQAVAEKLTVDLRGRVKLEDAGFDWKILGPDVHAQSLPYVAWQADQDAYAFSGQKCSAQSMLIAHDNWIDAGIIPALAERASQRNLDDLTAGPVLTWSTDRIAAHVEACLAIPGAKLEFGGKPFTGHSIPSCYGAFEPTAVSVPLRTMLEDAAVFKLATTELFGPFQIVTSFSDGELPLVLELVNRMENHLTAGCVSNDQEFLQQVLGNTVNGTMYAGLRATTTAAPQQHWFGPSGDPRSAGIHTPEAIKLCWSSHREIIYDYGPVAPTWEGKTT